MVFLCFVFILMFASGRAQEFTYDGDTGPQYWGSLTPAWALCSEGQSQSPININASLDTTNSLSLHWVDLVSPITILNNGHSYVVNVSSNSQGKAGYLIWNGIKYSLTQFHFHSPSEHHIYHKFYQLELHLVHSSASGGKLVVGFLFQIGFKNANPFVSHVMHSITQVPQASQQTNIHNSFHFSELLNSFNVNSFWSYSGSFTIPPCTEGVQWIVMANIGSVSDRVLTRYQRYFTFNSRYTQKLNGRVVV